MEATAIKKATKDNLRERVGTLLMSMYLIRDLDERHTLAQLCQRFKLTNNMGHILASAGIIDTSKGRRWEWSTGMPTEKTIDRAMAGYNSFLDDLKLQRQARQQEQQSPPAPIKQLPLRSELSTFQPDARDIDNLFAVVIDLVQEVRRLRDAINPIINYSADSSEVSHVSE